MVAADGADPARILEARPLRLVAGELDGADEADGAGLADKGMIVQAGQRLGEIGAEFAARSTSFSSSMISIFFSATAAATGWPA